MWFDFYAECSNWIDAQVYKYQLSNEECVFRYKHNLKSNKTMFVGINGLFSLINIIKTESNNLLSNHTYCNHGP